jgi:hypothetical protein
LQPNNICFVTPGACVSASLDFSACNSCQDILNNNAVLQCGP